MLFRKVPEINEEAFANVIVKQYYQTAEIFREYHIEYCCGARWPLKTVCEMNGIDFNALETDLLKSVQETRIPGSLPFSDWKLDFLTSYIINIHHQYLRQSLPIISERLNKFVEEHARKFAWLPQLQYHFNEFKSSIMPHLLHEEEIIFPYIRQIARAFESKESYAGLLVRTLRKPVEELMHHEQELLAGMLKQLRELTNNYTPPPNGCTSHYLVFCLLNELDDNLMQHFYLENSILFPKAIQMEKELLSLPG